MESTNSKSLFINLKNDWNAILNNFKWNLGSLIKLSIVLVLTSILS